MASLPTKSALAMMLPLMTACASIDRAKHAVSHQELARTDSVEGDIVTRATFSECSERESPIFSGDVDDGFGMTITVCAELGKDADNQEISILYSGEGGSRAVSCLARYCQEKIELRHYRRYRFTELTLQWRDENGVQRLVETFDTQDEVGPHHSLRHTWVRSDDEDDIASAESFPVTSDFAPLSLILLDQYLSSEPAR